MTEQDYEAAKARFRQISDELDAQLKKEMDEAERQYGIMSGHYDRKARSRAIAEARDRHAEALRPAAGDYDQACYDWHLQNGGVPA